MRQLRELDDEPSAQQLCDALLEHGIETKLLQSQRGGFGVWVVDEQKLREAQALTQQWLDTGAADVFTAAARRGRARRELSARIEDRRQRNQEVLAARVARVARPQPAVLTLGLIVLNASIYLMTEGAETLVQLHQRYPFIPAPSHDPRSITGSLLILDLHRKVFEQSISLLGHDFAWLPLPWDQPWRLVTPMLLHFNLLHVLFNLMMLGSFGARVELQHGARQLALLTLLSSALPNVLQLELGQNPMFGGMSGVVYALFGLLWMRGRLDPGVGYALSRGTVQFMLIWLTLGLIGEFVRVVGLTEMVGIANWCHLGGLLVGMGWGVAGAKLARRRP